MKSYVIITILACLLIFGCLGQIETTQTNDSIENLSIQNQNNSNSNPINNSNNISESNSTAPSISYNFSQIYNSEGKPIIWYFYSTHSCAPCINTSPLIASLKSKYGDSVDWREYDLQNETQGAVYWAMTRERKTPGCLCKIPAALINNTLLVGPISINNSLKQILSGMNYPASSNISKFDFSQVYSDDGKLIVYFFYSPTCPSCNAIKSEVERIGKKYENQTKWYGFTINSEEGNARYQQFFKEYNISPSRAGVPQIMVNKTILWGRYEINDSLEKIINGSIHPLVNAAQP